MGNYRVVFMPDHKEVDVEEGINLLDAAGKADIHINNLCGGQGLCGECRVQIIKGNARTDKHGIGCFSKEEVESGYVLACQTKVEDNLEILVPDNSQLEGEQILMEGIPLAYNKPEKVYLHKPSRSSPRVLKPLVSKTYLELPEPTIHDNISDVDRLYRELRSRDGVSSSNINLTCLKDLTATLRQHQWKVTASVAKYGNLWHILRVEGGNTVNRHYGLAIDVGTTTVVVQLINLVSGKVIGIEGSHNKQARYGEDVISRMIFACNRGALDSLNRAIIKNINSLIGKLIKRSGVDRKDITAVVAAGNTTMSHFLLGLVPCSIRLEPYVPVATVYPCVMASEIGININPEGIVGIMPSVASYVGGDIVAGILACGLAERSQISCLIDVGTNGEIAIGNHEWIVCCSASAGPAFEGAGTKWGMRATRGAIEEVEIENGQVRYVTIGRAKPRGICGAGMVECMYELARNNIIGKNGKFNLALKDSRLIVEDDDPQYIIAFPEETGIGQAVTITQSDIGNLIKSKGAVFAAIKSLVDYIGLSFDQLEAIYLAGGFGSSLDISKAISIGMLPDININKIRFIGNSSITGARKALLSESVFNAAVGIAEKMTNIELSNYQPFMNEFIAALFLPHTHGELFPSVKY